jgi:hypothetical protein
MRDRLDPLPIRERRASESGGVGVSLSIEFLKECTISYQRAAKTVEIEDKGGAE